MIIEIKSNGKNIVWSIMIKKVKVKRNRGWDTSESKSHNKNKNKSCIVNTFINENVHIC